MTFYKATRPDGTDFKTGTVDYAAALATGETIIHPSPGPMVRNDPQTYFSMSSEPGEVLLGGSWPCRLFTVEPAGAVIGSDVDPYKRCCQALRVTAEVDAHQALGPNGEAVAALIESARNLPAAGDAAGAAARAAAWAAAWDAAWAAAWAAARAAAWDAAGDAAWAAAWDAAWAAAGAAARAAAALLVRDLITPQQFDTLYGPWATVMEPAS